MTKPKDPKDKPSPGQPTKYKPEYCEQLIAHMAQGGSFESFAAKIETHRTTLYNWTEAHTAFFDARKKGLEKSLEFYETMTKLHITGHESVKGGSATMLIFALKNMHGWRDRKDIELTGKDGGPVAYSNLSPEELDQEIDALVAEAQKK